MFIAALFTIAKTWKQPKCPSTDEWINKIWYIHTMEYYSTIKSNEIMLFAATWMDLEIIMLSVISQKDKYHDIIYTWGLKYDTNELICNIEAEKYRQQTSWLPRGRGNERGMDSEFGISRYKLLYIE